MFLIDFQLKIEFCVLTRTKFLNKKYDDGEILCKDQFNLKYSQYLLYKNNIFTSFQGNNDTWDYYSFDMTGFSNNHLV